MAHPKFGQKSKPTPTSGLSRKDKLIKWIEKEPDKRFTSTELQSKLGFNTSHDIVLKNLNDLLRLGLIQSENETSPNGIKTVYFAVKKDA
jgi:hypothetical protein